MIGTLELFVVRGSLSSGEYPLFTDDTEIASHLVATINDVKFADGLQTTVDIPANQFVGSANAARLNSAFYWVTEYRQRTADGSSYTLTLDYMGPTTMYRKNSTIIGTWHKVPTNAYPYLKQQISNSISDITRKAEVPSIGYLQYNIATDTFGTLKGYWVQVSGFTSTARTTLRKVGFFVCSSEDENGLSRIHLESYTSGTTYPTFADLISDITGVTGILADQVVDCSISERCPYPYRIRWVQSGNISYGNPYIIDMDGTSQNASYGQIHKVYVLNDSNGPFYNDYTTTFNIGDITDFERSCGSMTLRDWNNQDIAEFHIPMSSTASFNMRVHSDISGIYTTIWEGNQSITFPEGKLPYISNSWEDYMAYQMNSDRTGMENAIRYAKETKLTSDVTGIANTVINAVGSGVIGGSMTGAKGGGTIGAITGAAGLVSTLYGNQRAYELTEMQAKDAMAQSYRQSLDAPQTSYNTGYGLIYTSLTALNGMNICMKTPKYVDSQYFSDWTAHYGFPAEGYDSFAVTYGFYQGKLDSSRGMPHHGMYFDRTNEIFMKGFRFVTP